MSDLPSTHLTVTINEESKELFMSAGLVRRLVGLANVIDDITKIYVDAKVQELMIVEVVRPHTPRGEAIKDYTLDDFEMSDADADLIIDWAGKHIVNFFTKSVQKLQAAVTDNGEIKTLMDSLNGLSALVVKKPLDGPSTAE